MSQFGAVSAAGSNMFERRKHCVAMGGFIAASCWACCCATAWAAAATVATLPIERKIMFNEIKLAGFKL